MDLNNMSLSPGNLPAKPSQDRLSFPTKVSSRNQVQREEKIKEISSKEFATQANSLPAQESMAEHRTTDFTSKTELSLQKSSPADATESSTVEVEKDLSPEEVEQLKELFWTRYQQPWPKAPKGVRQPADCEGYAHYLVTGKPGTFEETETPEIKKVGFEKEHRPYTCYKIWKPTVPWLREESLWSGMHYFVHLENGECISKNGCGPVRFFDSFKEMLLADVFHSADAFHGRFINEDGKDTNNVDEAVIGESMMGTILGASLGIGC